MSKKYLFLLQDALSILKKKWTIEIFSLLLKEHKRYKELLAEIEGISDKMLTERLQELQNLELVAKIRGISDNKMYYSLTSRCVNFVDLFYELSLFSLLKMNTEGSVSRGLVVGRLKREIHDYYKS